MVPFMPTLSSLIAYRPGKKARAAIKDPFSLFRGDSSTASTTSHQRSAPTEVLDINHSRFSSDLVGGNTPAASEQDVCDNPPSSQHNISPQVELDIDLSSNGFSDWLETFNGPDAKKQAHMKRSTRMKNSVSLDVKLEELKEGASSEDIITSLDTLHLGTPSEHNEEWSVLRRPHSMAIPDGSSPNSHQASRPPDLFIGTRTVRPLSSQSDMTSSALSGTTIARALMSNSFVLSADRASLYRRSGAGLTRSDSTTLPRWSRNSSMMLFNDSFPIGSDPPPPIPSNAELLYEPPRKLRNEENRPKRSSTGSLILKIPSATPPISNDTLPNSVIVNPDVDFKETFLPGTPPSAKPSISQSSLPHTPTRLTMEATTPDQASNPLSEEVNHQILVNAQVLSPDSDTPSSPPSGHTSPQELEGLMNYYPLADSPELLVTGFRPRISPISEESSSPLSPPFPYRSDIRDSQRSQPMSTRSQSPRIRDSTAIPMKDQPADLLPKILLPVEGGAQHYITPTTTTSDSSFYINGNDNPDTSITPPQVTKIINGRRSRSASSSTPRNSRDLPVSPSNPIAGISEPPEEIQSGSVAFSMQGPLAYRNETFRGRASDIFRGTSLGSPPPYYSVVSEVPMQDIQPTHFPGPPFTFSSSQGSDSVAGRSSGESTLSNDISRNLRREDSYLGQRTRIRPPLPAGPRRPSQQLSSSPFPQRRPFSSVVSCSVVSDSLSRPPTRTPDFQAPTPKWKGYTMEVAKWTFTSAQLQAIVAKAIRQSAEASSIRLLWLEAIDNEIPEEIQRLESQRTNIKMRYKATTRRRVMILDSLYSSLEDVYSAHRSARQLDELKELTEGLDRLAEEIHSVDQQLSHLESLIHVHTSSALALALRKLNSSFLKQVAENKVLRSQIQSLEAERDEAWRQAQSVANDFDQISEKRLSTRSSRVVAKHKSCIRLSRAGLRPPNFQHSPAGIGATSSAARRSLPPPLPKRRPMSISIASPRRSSIVSSSEISPTSESRALARAQDDLYALLGITNPEHPLHRSRSLSSAGFLSPRSAEGLRSRRSSLPGASSLTQAHNVMAHGSDSMFRHLPFQRNTILATIDILSATK